MVSLKAFFKSLLVFEKPGSEERDSSRTDQNMSPVYHDVDKQTSTDEQISGILQVGEDGFASEIHNRQSGAHRLSRTLEDIEFMPFYYLVDGSAGKKDIIIGIQHFGSHGIA